MPKEKHKKSDRKKKAGKKASQLAIRVEKSERDAFVTLCDTMDTSAAREIRRFMRDFVAAHRTAAPAEASAPDEVAEAPPAEPAPKKKPVTRRAPAKPRATPPAGTTGAETPPAKRVRRTPRAAPAN